MTQAASVTGESTQIISSPAVPIQQKPHQQQPTSLGMKLINGAIAGITGTCIIYPLDIVKTKLQNSSAPGQTAIGVFRNIVQQNGVRGLYKGLPVNLIGITPEKAIKLAVNDYAREYLANRSGVAVENLSIPNGMLAGGFAGLCQVIATNPMEITKINTQMRQGHIAPIAMAKELGLRGLYKGTPATLLRDVPFSFIFFPSSAWLKQKAAERNNGVLTFNAIFGSGIGAGVLAAVAVTPADVIKTRLQTMETAAKYTGIADCASKIWREEGLKAFFKGAPQRALIISPLFGITLLVYEAQQRLFGSK